VKIGLASADWSNTVKDDHGHPVWGGSGWARLGQYADRLEGEVTYGTLVSQRDVFGVRDWDGVDHFDCDVIVMQRYMFKDVARILKASRGTGQVVINDVDDWYWGLRPSNSAWLLSHPKFNEEENVNHYSTIVGSSTAVTVSTPYLLERLRQKVKGDLILQGNYVDLSRFKQRVHHDGLPVIGWVGSTAHRSGDLETVRGVLQPLHRDGYTFHHSGHLEGRRSFLDATGVPTSTLPLVAPALYPDSFVFDIGIVPLSDTPFNEAKSYIKGLEYAASGIPFVASDVGEYRRLHDEFGLGRVARNGKDWRRHIRQLSDPAVRAEEAARNLELVKAFDISFGVKSLQEILSRYAS